MSKDQRFSDEGLKRVKTTLAMSAAVTPVTLFMVTPGLGLILLHLNHEQPQKVLLDSFSSPYKTVVLTYFLVLMISLLARVKVLLELKSTA